MTDDKNPTNHPLYVVDRGLGTCMLHFSDEDNTAGLLQVEKEKPVKHRREEEDELCHSYTLMGLLVKKVQV